MFDIFPLTELTPDISIDLDYIVFPLITILVTWVVLKFLLVLIAKQISNFKFSGAKAIAKQILSIKPWTPVITGIYLSLFTTPIVSPNIVMFVRTAFLIVWIWEVIDILFAMLNFGVGRLIAKGDATNEATYRLLGRIAKVFIWSLVILMILSNLGLDVDSLIAGLGVGGIAIALAVQTVLSDLISSISIVTDKPFKVGDFVIINQYRGWIEKVGIRSTRVRSLDGEEIIIPNTELAKSSIQNYGNLAERRSQSVIGVTYETDNTLLKDIPVFIGDIILKNPKVNKDNSRIHLVEFGDSSINFEVVFYIRTEDYNEYLEVQQEVFFQINDKFTEEGISFAYPTQTVRLVN